MSKTNLYDNIFGIFTESSDDSHYVTDTEYEVAELQVAMMEHEVDSIIDSREKLDSVANLFEELIENETDEAQYAICAKALSVGLDVHVEVDGEKSAKGIIAKIIDGVKIFIRKLVEAVKNIWGKMFDKLLGSQDKLDTITTEIKAVKDPKAVKSHKLTDLSAYLATKGTPKALTRDLKLGIDIVTDITTNGAKYYDTILTAESVKEHIVKFYQRLDTVNITKTTVLGNLALSKGIIYPSGGKGIIIVGSDNKGYSVVTKSYEDDVLISNSVEVPVETMLEFVKNCPNKKELVTIRENFYKVTKDFLGKLDKNQDTEEIAKAVKDYTSHTTKMMHAISKGLIGTNKAVIKSAKQWLKEQDTTKDKGDGKTEE